jgi:hypothetical protein
MCLCRLWKDGLNSRERVEDAQALCGSKEPEWKHEACQYWSSMLSSKYTMVLHACWKLGRFDLESQTDTRNGKDFEFLTDSFESHGYPHKFSLFVEIWNKSLWLLMRDLMRWRRTFCLSWGATLQLNAILHYSDIETLSVSKNELLGITPS